MKTRNRVFVTGLVFAWAGWQAQAQGPDGMPMFELEPLIVMAPNLLQPEGVIPAGEIRSAKPLDLAGILAAELPSAALSRKSPLAGDLILRGFSRDNLLITVDDTRTYCACPNRMDPPAFHVSSQQVERVSVREGPFSVEQGASLGGAVFVQTAQPAEERSLRSYAYAGSFDYLAGGFSAGGALSGTLSGLGGVHYQRGGVYEDGSGTLFTRLPGTNFLPGVQESTAFEVYSAEAGIAAALLGGGKLRVNYGYQEAIDVLYPGLQMDAMSDVMNRGSVTLTLPVSSAVADEVEAALAFSHVGHDMRDSFRTSRGNMGGIFASRGYFMRTEADSAYWGGVLKARKDLGDAQLRYGLDLRRRLWDADNAVGMNANDMLPDVVADTLGFWSEPEWRRGPWALESGVRLDVARSEARQSLDFLQTLRKTDTNERSDVLPSAYGRISRALDSNWDAFAGVGMASRQPDPQERYLNLNRPALSPDWVGNPDLDPVQSVEFQAGTHWVGAKTSLTVSAFHAWLRDMVYLEALPLAAPARATSYTNLDARLYGFAVEASWQVAEHVRLESGLAWQEGVKDTWPARATNDILGEIPPLRARLAAIARFDDWSFQADVQVQDDLDRIDPDLQERAIEGWGTLNVSASRRITDHLSISGGIDNLTDETYAVANSFVRDPFSSNVIVNEAGRFLYLRAGVEF